MEGVIAWRCGRGGGHCEALLLRSEGLGSQDPALQLTSDGIFSAEWPSPPPYFRLLWGSNGTIQFISISFDLMETAASSFVPDCAHSLSQSPGPLDIQVRVRLNSGGPWNF